MPRQYLYKLTVDNGGAPCVQDGLLSLAICKPMIRSTARINDWLFGFAGKSLHPDQRLIFIARVPRSGTGAAPPTEATPPASRSAI
jgi:hypothetical protein